MTAERDAKALEVRHLLDASSEQAFDAWLTPAVVELWWGPHGHRTKVLRLEAVVGGAFAFEMTGPSGASCAMRGTYTTIERPHVLAFDVTDHCVADIPEHVRVPTKPSNVVVRFIATGGKTEIILIQTGLAADYELLADVGWSHSLERANEAFRSPSAV